MDRLHFGGTSSQLLFSGIGPNLVTDSVKKRRRRDTVSGPPSKMEGHAQSATGNDGGGGVGGGNGGGIGG